jgi:erythronate-4-phosphate dehydrogenase
MKIIADEKIPFVTDYFGHGNELILKNGRSLQREDVIDADMLLVRSVTRVNAALLQDSSVKFVGSSSSGSDHLDTQWLDDAGIRWASAAGCNSRAVVEYVISVIAALQQMSLLPAKSPRAAVIGVGRIGSQVAAELETLGFEVLRCDPLRASDEKDFISTPLDAITDCDFITLHTPLTHKGSHPTYHMIAKKFLQQQKKNAVLLNAARGSVVDFADLKEYAWHLYPCLDVWENEPLVDLQILQQASIATPHIAGHTLQAKQRGIEMIYQAAIAAKLIAADPSSTIDFPHAQIDFNHEEVTWQDVILKIYDPRVTTAIMQEKILLNSHASEFDHLRNDVNQRHEFEFITLQHATMPAGDKVYLAGLGLKFAI